MFFNLKRKDLYASQLIFILIHMNFNDAFVARTRDGSGNAKKYLQSLLLNRDRGNCSRFEVLLLDVPVCIQFLFHVLRTL